RGTRTYAILLAIVLLVLAGVLYEWNTGAFPWVRLGSSTPPPVEKQAQPAEPEPAVAPREEPKPPAAPLVAAAPETTVAPQAPASPPPTVQAPGSGEGRVRLEFSGQSWVEIRDKDGKMLMSQLNPVGSRRIVSGPTPLSLVIGNAANVRL